MAYGISSWGSAKPRRAGKTERTGSSWGKRGRGAKLAYNGDAFLSTQNAGFHLSGKGGKAEPAAVHRWLLRFNAVTKTLCSRC